MTKLIFCNVENRPFKDEEFFTHNGVTIHMLTDKSGHTLDGWPAKNDGSWEVVQVQLPDVAMERFE